VRVTRFDYEQVCGCFSRRCAARRQGRYPLSIVSAKSMRLTNVPQFANVSRPEQGSDEHEVGTYSCAIQSVSPSSSAAESSPYRAGPRGALNGA
jgi:hypothetical protein